jgi:hypothetical protein
VAATDGTEGERNVVKTSLKQRLVKTGGPLMQHSR